MHARIGPERAVEGLVAMNSQIGKEQAAASVAHPLQRLFRVGGQDRPVPQLPLQARERFQLCRIIVENAGSQRALRRDDLHRLRKTMSHLPNVRNATATLPAHSPNGRRCVVTAFPPVSACRSIWYRLCDGGRRPL